MPKINAKGMVVLSAAVLLVLAVLLTVSGAFTTHRHVSVKPNALCTNASISSMFGYYAGQLQTANNAANVTDELITLAQIKAVVGARLNTCAGQLTSTDQSELQSIQTEVNAAIASVSGS